MATTLPHPGSVDPALIDSLNQLQWLSGTVAGVFDEDDLRQEVLRRALARPPQRVHYRGWLRTVTRSVLRDFQRRTSRRRKYEADAARTTCVRHSSDKGEATVEAAEAAHLLREAVERLPEPQAQCIRLRFYANLSTAEIAEHLGIDQETVLRRERRGLETLRIRLNSSLGCLAAFATLELGPEFVSALTASGRGADLGAFCIQRATGSGARAWTSVSWIVGAATVALFLVTTHDETDAASRFDVATPLTGLSTERVDSRTPALEGDSSAAASFRGGSAEPTRTANAAARDHWIRVVDTLREPIQGAQVQVGLVGDLTGQPAQSSDPNGLVRLPDSLAASAFYVEVSARGRATTRHRITSWDDATRTTTIALHEPWTVTGQALDSSGNPIVGACVQTELVRSRDKATSETVTDAEGRFEVSAVGLSTLTVVARSFEPHQQPLPIHTRRLDPIQLAPVDWRPLNLGQPPQTIGTSDVVHLQATSFDVPHAMAWMAAERVHVHSWPSASYDVRAFVDASHHLVGHIEPGDEPSEPMVVRWDPTLRRLPAPRLSTPEFNLTLSGRVFLDDSPLWGASLGPFGLTDREGRFHIPCHSAQSDLVVNGAGQSKLITLHLEECLPGQRVERQPWHLHSGRRSRPQVHGVLTNAAGERVSENALVHFIGDDGTRVTRMTNGDGTYCLAGIRGRSLPGYVTVEFPSGFDDHLRGATRFDRVAHLPIDVPLEAKPSFRVDVEGIDEPVGYSLSRLTPGGVAFPIRLDQTFDPSHPDQMALWLVDGPYRLDFVDGRESMSFDARPHSTIQLPQPASEE